LGENDLWSDAFGVEFDSVLFRIFQRRIFSKLNSVDIFPTRLVSQQVDQNRYAAGSDSF